MTGFAAAVVEAWQELRIHKLRVLLSLIGVGVAVCSLTSAVALGSIANQGLAETYEKQDGRPATFGMYAYSESGQSPDAESTRQTFAETMTHFDISYFSIVGETALMAIVQGEERQVNMRIVDPPYADMRRLITEQGRWLTSADVQNLSPAVVVDARMLKALGLGPDSLPTTVTLLGDKRVKATIVGQVPKDMYTGGPTAFILPDAYERWFGQSQPISDPSYQMWVPEQGSKALGKAVQRELRAQLPGFSVDVGRQDYRSYGGDPLKELRYVVGGVSVLILFLGALSLLNIALVTIKQRVREIGIRRSFGATTGRVFFSVMMESVVATFVAGLVGVIAAVGVVKSPIVAKYLLDGVTDVPPFPISAAVAGLLVSLGVGALAGFLPAMVAVRVKIIDAIRF